MIQIRKLIHAPRAKVFRMWTEPGEIKKWWLIEGCTTLIVEMNPVMGGKYRIGIRPEEGDLYYISGIFNEVCGMEKLVYTWTSESADDLIKDTRVSVEFHDRGDSTEIVLTHEFLHTPLQAGYREGWDKLIERLILLCR